MESVTILLAHEKHESDFFTCEEQSGKRKIRMTDIENIIILITTLMLFFVLHYCIGDFGLCS